MADQTNFEDKGIQLIFPVKGGLVEKIEPLLQHRRPFSPEGSFNEFFLILRNNTKRRIEGWLTFKPPSGWDIAPGEHLMIAIRALKTISAEFYLRAPAKPVPGSNLLTIEILEEDTLLAWTSFELDPVLRL